MRKIRLSVLMLVLVAIWYICLGTAFQTGGLAARTGVPPVNVTGTALQVACDSMAASVVGTDTLFMSDSTRVGLTAAAGFIDSLSAAHVCSLTAARTTYGDMLIWGDWITPGTGEDSVSINGQSARRCVTIGPATHVTFQDIGFTGGFENGASYRAPYRGGTVVVASTGHAIFNRCNFSGGVSYRGEVGSIYLEDDAIAVFDSCTFTGAPSGLKASLLYASGPDSLIFTSCTFSGVTNADVPMIYVSGGSATDFLFKDCFVSLVAGDVFEFDGTFNGLTIVHSEFQDIGGQIIDSGLSKAVRVDSLRLIAKF